MNGSLVDWKDAKVHVLNHGLHYASSVFEGERVYNGKVFKLSEHSERLKKSAELLGFSVPYTVEELDNATNEVVKAQGIENGYVRPVAWRGSEKMAISAQGNTIHVAIATWSWPPYYKEKLQETGIRMWVSDWRRPAPNTAPCASKAAGLYMICTLSKHKAEEMGYHDAFMLDWRGLVAEGSSANFFMVVDGELHTPTADCFLNGITRQTVMELAKEAGIKVVERHIKPEELADAQEAFLTGTAAELTPIGEIDHGDVKYSFVVGDVFRKLKEAYHSLVRS
ncbi:MAG: branched-chain amino acid aminotransferase [Rickettsiales bacterium]|nr:branched-chain amino acid aminotransferase [Rickettsiales bacterium]